MIKTYLVALPRSVRHRAFLDADQRQQNENNKNKNNNNINNNDNNNSSSNNNNNKVFGFSTGSANLCRKGCSEPTKCSQNESPNSQIGTPICDNGSKMGTKWSRWALNGPDGAQKPIFETMEGFTAWNTHPFWVPKWSKNRSKNH